MDGDGKAAKAKQAAAALHRRNTRRAGALQFTPKTRAALSAILAKAGVGDDAATMLIRETEYAAALYPQDDEPISLGDARTRIAKFTKAANRFAAAWRDLGEQLQHAIWTEDLGSQALAAAFCAELFEDDVGDSKAHDPASYRFVMMVAELWRRAGIHPSFTNNVDAGDAISTPFERFIELCALRPIGRGIIREALATDAVGDKSADV